METVQRASEGAGSRRPQVATPPAAAVHGCEKLPVECVAYAIEQALYNTLNRSDMAHRCQRY